MAKSILVLSVPHEVQGQGFRDYLPDQSYSQLIADVIKHGGVDFVFEEARGIEPSIAKNLSVSFLGPGHYLDVDVPLNEREKSDDVKRIAPEPLFPRRWGYALVQEQEQREQDWIKR